MLGLKDKASITLLRHLLNAVDKYGKPRFLRTDNEAIFTPAVSLRALAVGDKAPENRQGVPGMNGRVERFFGTLKGKLNHWEVDSLEQLNGALGQFRFWYNHVRPHQNLDGLTPAEVWAGKNVYIAHTRKEFWFEAWDGLLTGYYLRI